jgi:glycosyltransferase involved in cell wall biosynthesis
LLLAKPGSVDALAEAILTLRANPALAQRLATNARRHIEECYTWAHSTAALNALYRPLSSTELAAAPVPARS